jgi:hypothetical protein
MALSKNGILKQDKIISNKIMIVILQSIKYPWNTIIRKSHPCEKQFDSDSHLLIKRRSIKILLRNKKLVLVELLNDLGMGAVFARIRMSPQSLSSINRLESGQLNRIKEKSLEIYHHFKLKSFKYDQKNDFRLFQELHGRLN